MPGSSPKPPPSIWRAFPGAYLWGAVFAIATAALSYLGIPDEVRRTYLVGWLAMAALSLSGLSSEWRKDFRKLKGATLKACESLQRARNVFAIIFVVLTLATVRFYLVDTALHKTLILHKPWFIQYGNILSDGKNRVYVHARFNNTATEPIKFQVYGKAMMEPLSLTRAESEKISDKLQDDVRLIASGDDAPVLTANPRDDEDPTTYDVSGAAISKKDFDAFRIGKAVVYYAVLVYVKERNQTRFALRDCEISRAVTKSTSAGELPYVGRLWVHYPWIDETPCDDTGKH